MRSSPKSGVLRVLLLALAGSGLSLAAKTPDLPNALDSGWVLADLNGDQSADLATAQSGRHDAGGYWQEVRVTLGGFRQTHFTFRSRGATVELSSRDVDGDRDGDLIVFEPLSSQPIGVWLNDGAGSFHEGRLADFRQLWNPKPGPTFRVRLQRLALFATSDERTQSLTPPAAIAVPEPIDTVRTWQDERARHDARRSAFRPRAPPRNS